MLHNSDGTHKTEVKSWLSRKVAEWTGTNVCFVAGTPIQWQHGAKAIEAFQSYEECGDNCDWIVSRIENDPDGPLVRKRVLRTFARVGPVLALHVRGQVIETTWEHPFFALERGLDGSRVVADRRVDSPA